MKMKQSLPIVASDLQGQFHRSRENWQCRLSSLFHNHITTRFSLPLNLSLSLKLVRDPITNGTLLV
ncbi:hypothetical protein JHK85_041483 [Glycine max]|uniref:Uncharacterized protein n=1 Tax=Glycine max TaxID=3847 RepID=K7M8B6_SOYBN|nr:hypothetical protein JHK87_040711 [Glycine soja]KAG4966508.1 hypothetical protein JHK85_041483 [Glycine max]KAH1095555.1 hypothetical protein GYH30_040716 [Glycine max]